MTRSFTLPVCVTLDFDAAVYEPVEREHGCLKSATHRAHDNSDIIWISRRFGKDRKKLLAKRRALLNTEVCQWRVVNLMIL